MMIDRAVVLQALKAMEANRYAVADQAPHGDVMAYNAATEALRAAVLAQERARQEQVTYSTGGFHLEAGFYSAVDLREMLKALDSMNAAARSAMEEMP